MSDRAGGMPLAGPGKPVRIAQGTTATTTMAHVTAARGSAPRRRIHHGAVIDSTAQPAKNVTRCVWNVSASATPQETNAHHPPPRAMIRQIDQQHNVPSSSVGE